VRLIGAARTDRGLVRRENQDSYGFSAATGLYLVADGMGGQAAGKRASEEAARVVTETVETDGGVGGASGAERLRRAIEHANAHLWQLAQAEPGLRGMGTTIASVLVEGDVAHVANVGDSRVYRIRAGELTRLTRDHSYLAEFTERGIELPNAEVRARYGSVLSRAVGIAPTVEVDVRSEPIVAGDTYVICSDGVHRLVEPAEMCALVAAGGDDLEQVCRAIVAHANAAGGPDNSTVIVLRAVCDGAPGTDDGGRGAP
jgi:serine/threonine protein phosphatase PrpC